METKSKTEATAPSFGDTKHDNHAPKYRQVDILESLVQAVLSGLAKQVHVVSATSQAWLNKQQSRSHSVRMGLFRLSTRPGKVQCWSKEA